MPESENIIQEEVAGISVSGDSTASDPGDRDGEVQKIIRNVLTLGMLAMPVMAYIDYQLDYLLVAVIELIGVILIPAMLWLSEKPRFLQTTIHLTLGYLFLLFSAVAVSQLDSSASLLWYPLVPILFFYLSHFWAGLTWSVALFVVLLVAYVYYPDINNKAPVSGLFFIHTIITYIAGTLIGGFFELKRNPLNINLGIFDDME